MNRILLTGADIDTHLILNRVLNDAGYHIECLKEATEIVEGRINVPDVFILDQKIPAIDGFALSKFLRVKAQTKDIPIIMLSSYPELRHKAAQIGVNEFLCKPFTANQLLTSIKKQLSYRRIPSQPSTLQVTFPKKRSLNSSSVSRSINRS